MASKAQHDTAQVQALFDEWLHMRIEILEENAWCVDRYGAIIELNKEALTKARKLGLPDPKKVK